MTPRGELSVRSSEDGTVIAVYAPLVLFHLTRRMNERELACLTDVIDEGLRAGSPWGMLLVFARGELSGGIDPKAREIFERLVRQDKNVLERSALVIAAEGFPGAVIRSIVAGLLQLTGKRTELKVFASVPEACERLAKVHDLEVVALARAYASATAPSR